MRDLDATYAVRTINSDEPDSVFVCGEQISQYWDKTNKLVVIVLVMMNPGTSIISIDASVEAKLQLTFTTKNHKMMPACMFAYEITCEISGLRKMRQYEVDIVWTENKRSEIID